MAAKKGLYPSLLSADFAHLGRDCRSLEELGVTDLHLDVMDGRFVPQVSFGEPLLGSLRKSTSLVFDVHLMVEHPEDRIASMKAAGADRLTVHAEGCYHLDRVLQAIHDAGMESGVALNPSTPLCVLDYILDKADQILLMSVNPGYGGQSYIPSATGKIAELRKKLDESGHADMPIQVDGGISVKNAAMILEAGADRLVAGSGVFNGNMADNVKQFLQMI
ncbi:MAG: ribulose-phosphate 3-epimerase [Eubacterium sp.]|nr:ribulose-phosphate 3-epimerase [Eubacterium sp.]